MDIFDEIAPSMEESKGDIFDQLTSPRNSFSWKAKKTLPMKIKRAFKAAQEKPSLLASELPIAAIQLGEALGTSPITSQIENFIRKKESPTASSIAKEYLRKDLEPHLQEGAQDISDLEEFLLGFLPIPGMKGLKNPPTKSIKVPPSDLFKERAAFSEKMLKPQAPETFKSGLSKPRAVDSTNAKLGAISKGRQQSVIQNLDEEAKNLIKGKIKKHLPISQKIQEGFDFSGDYEKRFGQLKNMAEKYNPTVETQPISNFFRDIIEEYRGVPKQALGTEEKNILNSIKGYRKNMPSDLSTWLKIFRANNRKRTRLWETRHLKGTQKEYTDFLSGMNRAISDSFSKTLPEDSAWMKEFLANNKDYAQYKSTLNTVDMLEPILKEKLSTSSLSRLADDSRIQKKLSVKMNNKEGAAEIIQIAKDLKKARESIKRIPVKDLNKYDAIWPISWVFKPAGVISTLKKGSDFARKGYGYYLTTPARRKAFDEALKSLERNDINSFKEATKNLPPFLNMKASEEKIK